MMYCRLIKVLFVLAIAACLVTPAMAGKNWDGVGGWDEDLLWQGDPPGTGPPVGIRDINIRSGILNVDGIGVNEAAGLQVFQLKMGHPGGADGGGTAADATLNMTNGSLHVTFTGGTNGNVAGVADQSGHLAVNLSGSSTMTVDRKYQMLGYGGASTCCEVTTNSSASLTISDSATLTVQQFRFGVGAGTCGTCGPEAATNSFLVQLDGGVLHASSIDLGSSSTDGTPVIVAPRDFQLNGGTFRMTGNVPDIPSDIIPYVSGLGGVNKGGGLDVAYIRNYDSVYTNFTGLSEAIPEPTTLTLLGLGGFVAFMVSGRRRRQR